jgi:prepilin-type N-terminal cleavage/methylation domain-containing protein
MTMSTCVGALRRRIRRVRATGDAGVTLIEVIVSTTIMSILMAVSTAGMLQMYRSATKSEVLAQAQAQMQQAYMRLDREIRYASEISTPGKVGSDYYVEYQLTDSASVLQCVELRLTAATATLERRMWADATTPTGNWNTLADNVTSSLAGNPFTLTDGTLFQALRIQVKGSTTTNSSPVVTGTDATFTALNTNDVIEGGSTTHTVCSAGRS